MRKYARLLRMVESLPKETEARSLVSVVKYCLVAYVHWATKRFHDKEVSSMIAGTLESYDYCEDTHKMWRARNYRRLEPHLFTVAKFLQAAHVVIGREK